MYASSATGGSASGSSSRRVGSRSSGASNFTSPGASNGGGGGALFGALDAVAAQLYDSTFIDYQPGTPPSQRVVDDDAPCDKYNESFKRTADAINGANIAYSPMSTNSNATVTEMLRRAGINVPKPIVKAWGWGTPLLP